MTSSPVSIPPERLAWSSTAPSGRPWRLRIVPRSPRFPSARAFDLTTLPSYAAWDAAWSAMVDRHHGYDSLHLDAILQPLRPALAAAFTPLLHELAEQHHLARNDAFTDHPTPYHQRSLHEHQQGTDSRAYHRLVEDETSRLVEQALEAGLFDTVLDTVTQMTPASSEAPRFPTLNRLSGSGWPTPPSGLTVPLWDKLPTQKLGLTVMLAALGQGFRDRPGPQHVAQRIKRLVDGSVADAFWHGWAQQVVRFTDLVSPTMEKELGQALGSFIASLTRRPALIEVSGPLLSRLALSQGMAVGTTPKHPLAMPWQQLGASVGETLKRDYPKFGEAPDALFTIAPPEFWAGVRSEVNYNSKMGRWINAHLMAPALANPEGPEAQSMCWQAWLNLDKKEILDLEAALPGISLLHLPALTQNNLAHHAFPLNAGRNIHDLVKVGENPGARWATAVFRRAGAPVDESRAFEQWVAEDPARTVRTLMALRSKLESDVIRKAFAPDQDLPQPARSASRRRL